MGASGQTVTYWLTVSVTYTGWGRKPVCVCVCVVVCVRKAVCVRVSSTSFGSTSVVVAVCVATSVCVRYWGRGAGQEDRIALWLVDYISVKI